MLLALCFGLCTLCTLCTLCRSLTIITKETGHIFSGLQPESRYEVQLRSRAAGSSSSSSSSSRPLTLQFRTERAAATPSVSHLSATVLTATQTRISWKLSEAAAASCKSIRLVLLHRGTGSQVSHYGNCSAANGSWWLTIGTQPQSSYRAVASLLSADSGASRPSVVDFLTPAAAPAGSPRSLAATVEAGGRVRLSWLPPAPGARNGAVVAYRLRLRSVGAGSERRLSVTGDAASCRLPPLPSGQRFEARVAAETDAGLGPFTPWKTFSTVAAAPPPPARLRSRGSEQSLAARLKPTSVSAVGKQDSILLSWTRPHEQPEQYKVYRGTKWPRTNLVADIPGDSDVYQIRGLQSNQSYFISLVAVKGSVTADVTLQARTGNEKASRPSPPVPMEVRATPVDSRTAVVTWTDPELGPAGAAAAGRAYQLEWATEAAPDAVVGRRNSTSLLARLGRLRPYTSYSVRVRSCQDAGRRCSAFSLRAPFTTRSAAPADSPRRLRASAVRGLRGSVRVTWLPPDNPNGPVASYTVVCSRSPDGADAVARTVPAIDRQAVFADLLPAELYYFRVTANAAAGHSPTSAALAYVTHDLSGKGGGMVGGDEDSDIGSRLGSESRSLPALDSQTWWLLIGCGFGLAVLLLAAGTAAVCCRCRAAAAGADRRPKEAAQLIGQEAANRTASPGLAKPQQQQQQQQQQPDVCRHSDSLQLQQRQPLLLAGGFGADRHSTTAAAAAEAAAAAAHLRAASACGVAPFAAPPPLVSVAAGHQFAASQRTEPADLAESKLSSSPHLSLSSSLGSPSNRNMPTAMTSSQRHNAPPDILHPLPPPSTALHHSLHGASTFGSNTSRSLALSTEDVTKTLDGLMNDLKSLTNREFEC